MIEELYEKCQSDSAYRTLTNKMQELFYMKKERENL